MKKRYIDFVPAKKGAPRAAAHSGAKKVAIPPVNPKKPTAPKPIAKKPAVKPASKPPVKKSAKKEVEDFPEIDELFAARPNPAGVSTGFSSAKLGIIEDYQPKFVKTEVKKRPLGGKPAEKPVEKPAEKKEEKKVEEKKTEKKPEVKKPAPLGQRSPYLINTDKIEKRPLSKNVYSKKPPVAKEKPSGPVKIIAKPEKDSKVGLIIAIILTIILGTAAGTVAFLLLPK